MSTYETDAGIGRLQKRWWLLAIRGVATIALGVITIVMPQFSRVALLSLFGAYALVDGLFTIGFAVVLGRAGLRWGWALFEGLVGIAVAAITFLRPEVTALGLLLLVGFWAMVIGAAQVATGIRLGKHLASKWLVITGGIAWVAFGMLAVLFPRSGELALLWSIGAYTIAVGLSLVVVGLRLHRWSTGPGKPGMTERHA